MPASRTGSSACDELGDVGVAVAEALEVGDALRGFEAEAEGGGGGGEPAFEHFGGGQGAEGVVDLDGVELGGVELEELLGGDVGGVEAGLPGGVGPAGGSGEEVAAALRERLAVTGGEVFDYARHNERLTRRHDESEDFFGEGIGAASGFRTHDIRCHRAAFCH